MDPIVSFNKARWEELSASNVQYSVPMLDLDSGKARAFIDPERQLAGIAGRKVLCLAASGGQQSAAFGILGADVTVFDISENQLARDRSTAEHYRTRVQTIQGDMQDLSVFEDGRFDVVWLAHSINFVPDARKVLREAARVCAHGGRTRISFTNPYVHGVWNHPTGDGFLLSRPYIDGAEVNEEDMSWTFSDPAGRPRKVEGPREFRHSLSTIMNCMIQAGLRIDGFWEHLRREASPEKGSWSHFETIAPPWLTLWATKGAAPA